MLSSVFLQMTAEILRMLACYSSHYADSVFLCLRSNYHLAICSQPVPYYHHSAYLLVSEVYQVRCPCQSPLTIAWAMQCVLAPDHKCCHLLLCDDLTEIYLFIFSAMFYSNTNYFYYLDYSLITKKQ